MRGTRTASYALLASRTGLEYAVSTTRSDEHRACCAGAHAGVRIGEQHDGPGRPPERRERRGGSEAAVRLGRREVLLYPGLDTQIAGLSEREPRAGGGLADVPVVRRRAALGGDALTGDRLELLQRGVVVGLRVEEARERGDLQVEVLVLRDLADRLELGAGGAREREGMQPIAA